MPSEPIDVDDLFLDIDNPRFLLIGGAAGSVRSMLDYQGQKLVALAAHIAEHGLNPAESILVTEERDQQVVLDGNRRVAAMKLLLDPTLAGDSPFAPEFVRLTANRPRRTQVDCARVGSREEARPWIQVQHSGQMGGVGTSPWGPVEQYRWDPKPNIQVGHAVRFMDMVRRLFPSDQELLGYIVEIEGGRPSTLGRLVAGRRFRKRMGMTAGPAPGFEYESSLPREVLRPAARYVLADFAGTATVDYIKSSEDREKYVDDLPLPGEAEPEAASSKAGTGPTPPHRPRTGTATSKDPEGPAPSSAADPTPDPQQRLLDPPPAATKARPRREPPTPVPLGKLHLRYQSARTMSILRELRRPGFVDESPNAAAALLRAILDITVNEMFNRLEGVPTEEKILRSKIKRCLRELDPKKENSRFQPIRTGLDDPDSIQAVNTLHAYVHSSHYEPTPAAVRAIANGWEPFVQALDDHLADL